MPKQPIKRTSQTLSPERQRVLKENNRMTGTWNTQVAGSDRAFLEVKQNQKSISNPGGGAFILLGKDAPGSPATGYGGKGATHCATIHMPVGIASSKEFTNETVYSPNFTLDAVTIYASELTDLHANFGIAHDGVSKSKAKSGLGLKADHSIIIGRESTSIVTGRSPVEGAGPDGETNSRGGRIDGCGRITFIAGNYTEDEDYAAVNMLDTSDVAISKKKKLQPLVKGDQMIAALEELSEILSQLLAQVKMTGHIFDTYVKFSSKHIHICPPVGPSSTGDPILAIAGSMQKTQRSMQKQVLKNIQTQIDNFQRNFTTEKGSDYINSKHVLTT